MIEVASTIQGRPGARMLIALVVALLHTACTGAAQQTMMPYVGMFPLTEGDYNVGVVAKVGVEAAFANQNQWFDESLRVCKL